MIRFQSQCLCVERRLAAEARHDKVSVSVSLCWEKTSCWSVPWYGFSLCVERRLAAEMRHDKVSVSLSLCWEKKIKSRKAKGMVCSIQIWCVFILTTLLWSVWCYCCQWGRNRWWSPFLSLVQGKSFCTPLRRLYGVLNLGIISYLWLNSFNTQCKCMYKFLSGLSMCLLE